MGLGQLDALEIASKLQKAEIKAMPKFLSDEDEEAVRKALSFLRSSSLAIKTWMLKEATIQAKANTLRLSQAKAQAYAESLRKASVAGVRCAALKRAENKVAELTKELASLKPNDMARRYQDLQRRLDRAESRFSTYIWQRIDEGDSRYTIKTAIESTKAVRFIKEAEGKELPNLAFIQSDPQGRTLLISYNDRVRNITAELRKMGLEPSYSIEEKRVRAEKARFEAKDAHRDAVASVSALEHGREVEKTAIEQCHLAGQFYIIAALGDALEEFGASLAY